MNPSANYLELNLQRLFSHDRATTEALRTAFRPQALEIRYSKDGLPVPVVNHKCLHSPYDPQVESRKWVASLKLPEADYTCIVLGGLGFAYHLSELLKIFPPDRITVVEPNLELAAAAFASRPPEVFPEGLTFILGKTAPQAYLAARDANAMAGFALHYIGHPACAGLKPEYYHTLSGIFQAQGVADRGGYKILVVSPLYGGSWPLASYACQALNSLGHRAEMLDNSPFYPGLLALNNLTSNHRHQSQLRGLLTTLLAEAVTARAMAMGADLVLGLAQSPFTPHVLSELKTAGIRTAFWFVEDFELFPYWKGLAPHFDHYFVIQKEEFSAQLEAAGCHHHHYLPVAADPLIHRPWDLSPEEVAEFGSDISHVGAGYHNRRQTFLKLLDYDFQLWGNDWDDCGPLTNRLQRNGARLSTEDCVKVFNATRLNLNLHSSTYHEAVNPFGDFLNPRTFEIAACGGFQLVDERSLMGECFGAEEMATFHDLKDLRDKVDYYLTRPEDRRQMAILGRERVLAQHTYRHRMLELLGVIAGSEPEWTPKAGGLPTAEEIIREAGPQSDLVEVMRPFLGQGPLTLEGLSAGIERRDGDLSRTEAMILLLNEFRRWGLEKGVL
jgi:spore maturation protein CgeB